MLSYQDLLTAIPLIIKAGNVPTIAVSTGIRTLAPVEALDQALQARSYKEAVGWAEEGDLQH